MFSSHILSRLLRFGLLGVFIVGLFVSIGEVSVNQGGTLSLSQGGWNTASAVTPPTGEAATPGANDTKAAEPESRALETFIDIANLFIGVLTFLITPLIMLAGWLLSPDWTFGEIFGLRPILHQIWIFISNIVYVIFGFFLVFIAFANIFGGEHAKAYEMKSMLPKLVTGILIVPFTWFIVSAVLSISNILTASVIQLPIDTIQKAGSAGTFLDDKIIPREITYDKDKKNTEGSTVDGNGNPNGGGTNTANGNFYATECSDAGGDTTQANREGGLCLSIRDILTNGKGGAYNLLSVYAYGIFNIQNYKFITTKEKLGTIGKIASKLSFGFLFFIVFGILIIAIVYALFSRALILWLYAMFSPIFALNHVMEFKNESVKGSIGRMSIEKFLSLALVPVYVSAALAFGLMFLGLVMNAKGTITGAAGEGSLKSEIVDVNTKDSVSTFKFGDVTLTTKGVLTGEQKSGLNGALDLGKGIIGTIIMNVLALVILWMAVMAALNADEVTKSAVAPIKSFGDEVGKLALKSPQYIPIPLPDGKKVSMAGLSNIPGTISSAMSTRATQQGGEIGKSFAKALGIEVSELTEALQTAPARLKVASKEGQRDIYKDIFSKIPDRATFDAQKSENAPKIKAMIENSNVFTPDDQKALISKLEKGSTDDFFRLFNATMQNRNQPLTTKKDFTNTEEFLKDLKDGTQRIINVHPITMNSKNPDTGSTSVDVDKINISDIGIKIKDGKLNNREEIQNTIKREAGKQKIILSNPEIDEIINKIESRIPSTPEAKK